MGGLPGRQPPRGLGGREGGDNRWLVGGQVTHTLHRGFLLLQDGAHTEVWRRKGRQTGSRISRFGVDRLQQEECYFVLVCGENVVL